MPISIPSSPSLLEKCLMCSIGQVHRLLYRDARSKIALFADPTFLLSFALIQPRPASKIPRLPSSPLVSSSKISLESPLSSIWRPCVMPSSVSVLIPPRSIPTSPSIWSLITPFKYVLHLSFYTQNEMARVSLNALAVAFFSRPSQHFFSPRLLVRYPDDSKGFLSTLSDCTCMRDINDHTMNPLNHTEEAQQNFLHPFLPPVTPQPAHIW